MTVPLPKSNKITIMTTMITNSLSQSSKITMMTMINDA